jgi:hypothetical protein
LVLRDDPGFGGTHDSTSLAHPAESRLFVRFSSIVRIQSISSMLRGGRLLV